MHFGGGRDAVFTDFDDPTELLSESASQIALYPLLPWSLDASLTSQNIVSYKTWNGGRLMWVKMRSRCMIGTMSASFLLLNSLTACAMQSSQELDTASWKSQRGVDFEKNNRIHMMEAVKGVIHVGMSKNDVLTLLGPPDYSEDGESTSTDVYYLGISPYAGDTQEYDIKYKDGKVVSHNIVQG